MLDDIIISVEMSDFTYLRELIWRIDVNNMTEEKNNFSNRSDIVRYDRKSDYNHEHEAHIWTILWMKHESTVIRYIMV